jgi:hypothetical protein
MPPHQFMEEHGLLFQKPRKKKLKQEKPVCPRRPKQILGSYCMRLWDEWKMHRNVTSTKRVTDDITEMSSDELQYWMC